MAELPDVVAALADRLATSDRVRDLQVAGSLATGDYIVGVSDLDLVAVIDRPVDPARRDWIADTHRALDRTAAAGTNLGCVYVDEGLLLDPKARHPTWTHGQMVDRIVSGITRAELVRYGFAVLGREPGHVWPPMTDDDVRAAGRAELHGYWSWAARRPWLWRDPEFADLSLTSMARGRHTQRTGELLTKSRAVHEIAGPPWLRDHVAARRRGEHVSSPRLRTAYVAWRDTRRTTAAARDRTD